MRVEAAPAQSKCVVRTRLARMGMTQRTDWQPWDLTIRAPSKASTSPISAHKASRGALRGSHGRLQDRQL